MTSLVVGILIGVLLTHYVPLFRKKSRKFSTADVYERPEFNQFSVSSDAKSREDTAYTELQIRGAQSRKTVEEVSPYEL